MDLDPTDPESLRLLADSVRTTMTESSSASGEELDAALTDLGWLDMLDEMPDVAIPLVFRLLGETGAHAAVLNDVVLCATGGATGRYLAATVRRWLLGGMGAQRRFRFGDRRLAADTSCAARGLAAAAALRGAAGTGLVAGRHQPGHAVAGATACRGPRSIRPSHQLVSSDPTPAGRDTRRDRGCRGDTAYRRACQTTPTAWRRCWPRPQPARQR